MNAVQRILGDLRDRRLLPVVVLLLVAIIAVPVALSKSAAPAPTPPPTPAPASIPGAATLPAVTVKAQLTPVALNSRPHNPFAQGAVREQKAAAAKAKAKAATTKGSTTSTTSSATSTASGGGGVATNPKSPAAKSRPAPTGLSATQSYETSMAFTDPATGGLSTVDPVERLSLIPRTNQPLLVELGVLQGGERVLFAVLPGTIPAGAGSCTPGPLDCEVLSLAPNQDEQLFTAASRTVPVTDFAVTEIRAANHVSAAAADRARRQQSAAGARAIARSGVTALSLFEYRPSVGAVVDLRNLTVGGS